jgi:ferrochelatase
MVMKERIAVVLFNLGGPDSLQAVRPFLFNLFSDRAILRLPAGLRYPLAWILAAWRARTARTIYARMGGASPLTAQTFTQARALKMALEDLGEVEVVVAMRYWRPRAREVLRALKDFRPERVVVLPLYPQFSTTTTASSLAEWKKEWAKAGLQSRLYCAGSYPTATDFVAAHVAVIETALFGKDLDSLRLLFSAHGLPERIVAAGDPYPYEVEASARAVVRKLNRTGLDWRLCYQSRIGPLRWIGPSTEDEIRKAGEDKKAVVIVPISFVSEHSETLVELDKDYAVLARRTGVTDYKRMPALGTHPSFIAALAEEVRNALTNTKEEKL